MMILGCSWFLWDSAENLALFQLIMAADPHLCHTHFAPRSLYAEGHVLEVVIVEKDTLQVVDDHIDGPVRGIPDLGIVGAPGYINPDQHEVQSGKFDMKEVSICSRKTSK